jgi:hypothetical protein
MSNQGIDDRINDMLQGGAKSYSWDEVPVNTVHRLKIVSATVVPVTDFTTKEPRHWPNGDPMEQIRVIGDTDERDPSDEADDGRRAEYFNGQKRNALRDVLKKQGVSLAVGGELAVKLLERKKLEDGKKQNIFAVQYTAPPEPAFDPNEEPF